MFPKITKRDGPEIISGHLFRVTGTGGLLHIGGEHHLCTRAFENKPSSLLRALTPYGYVTPYGYPLWLITNTIDMAMH